MGDWEIQGPDDEGHVWIVSGEGVAETWGHNLGPVADVMEKFSQFLGSQDYQEDL